MNGELEICEFSETCRTCLSKESFYAIQNDSGMLNLYSQFTGIEVLQDDLLPKNICQNCVDSFERIGAFIGKCRNSYEILCNVLNDNENNADVASPLNIYIKDEIIDEQIEPIECNSEKNTNPVFFCGSCGGKFVNRKEMNDHYIQSKLCKKNEYKCSHCNKIFGKRYKLLAHMRCHTKESPFQCKICLKTFRFSQNLRRHRKAHDGIKPFVCHVCNKAFSRATSREEHLRVHSGETPFKCEYCGKCFKRYNSHHLHLIWHQLDNGELPDDKKEIYKKMECRKCAKQFSSKSALRAHELIHTGEKMFLCNDCGKNFFTKGALQSHYKTHTGVKPYKCSQCEKSFTQNGGLKNHMLTHMGVKPHSCSICNRSFTQNTHLKNHMRTHSGEKPYVCIYCNKGFALNCNLKVHQRIHTGETPYRCSLCNMGFYDSSNLKKHKKGHEIENGKKNIETIFASNSNKSKL